MKPFLVIRTAVFQAFCLLTLLAGAFAQDGNARNCLEEFAKQVNKPLNVPLLAKVFAQSAKTGPGVLAIGEVQRRAAVLGLLTRVEKLDFSAVLRQRGPVILALRAPEEFVVVASMSKEYALVSGSVKPNVELKRRYSGKAIVLGAAPGSAPALWVDEPVRVVKIAASGAEVVQQVKIENRSPRSPVKLEVSGTSCGCTVAQLPLGQLAPGQATTLGIKMKVDEWGGKAESVTLRTDDPLWPQIVVLVKAETPQNIVFSPERMTIRAQEGVRESRILTVLVPGQAAVARVVAQPTYLSAQVLSRSPVRGGFAERVQVEVAKDAPPGDFMGRINFDFAHSDAPSASVSVEVSVLPDVAVEPGQLFLGQIPVGGIVRKSVAARSVSGKTFRIQSVDCSDPRVKVKANFIDEAVAHTIEVEVSPQSERDMIKGVLRLHLATGRSIQIPVIGLIGAGK